MKLFGAKKANEVKGSLIKRSSRKIETSLRPQYNPPSQSRINPRKEKLHMEIPKITKPTKPDSIEKKGLEKPATTTPKPVYTPPSQQNPKKSKG